MPFNEVSLLANKDLLDPVNELGLPCRSRSLKPDCETLIVLRSSDEEDLAYCLKQLVVFGFPNYFQAI